MLQLASIQVELLFEQEGDTAVCHGCLLLMDDGTDEEINTSDILYVQECCPN